MTTTIVYGNNKGGVGKTFVVVQSAHVYACKGMSVGVVDLDPQANASRRLGWEFDPQAPVPTLSEALKSPDLGVAAQIAIPVPTDYTGSIDLLPSRFDLENRVSEAATVGASRRLVKILEGWRDNYDVILIDVPPSMGHLTQLGLVAADVAVLVSEPEYDSIEACVRFFDFVSEHAADLPNPALRVAGLVMNKYRPVNEHRFQVEEIKDTALGGLLMDPFIPHRIAIGETNSASAVPISVYDKELMATFEKMANTVLTAAQGGR